MTMRELAKLANVSVSTASKAFHDAPDISQETRERVFSVAKQYGCFGKFYKGKFHKQVIAIICPELGSSFYTAYVERLQALIEHSGGIALISSDRFDTSAQAELMEYYASYLKVDGIIAFDLRAPVKKGYDIPVVSIFSSPDPNVDTVTVDLKAPMQEAVQLLHTLGHKNLAFIGEELTGVKETLFRKAAGNGGFVVKSDLRFEKAGEDGAHRLLEQAPQTTAIICAYDKIALGAIRYLTQKGYRVPEDFSVVGIDNISTAEHSQTALTTIDTNPDEVCMIAWDIIQKKQQSKYYRSNQAITITGKLLLRETVGKCKMQNA